MIHLNGFPFTFKLEPIINIFSQKVMGFEILSKPQNKMINTEAFFLSQPDKILETVFYEQLSFFTKKCNAETEHVNDLFINLPLCLLLREEFLQTLHEYQLITNLNLEIQYDPVTITPEVMSFLKTLSLEGVRIWIDDVDVRGMSIFNDPASLGLKIDKNTFWAMYKSQDKLPVFTHCSENRLIVEGVETADHIHYLKDNGVFLGQGYYWPAIEYR